MSNSTEERIKDLENTVDFQRNKLVEQNVKIAKLMEGYNNLLSANIEHLARFDKTTTI